MSWIHELVNWCNNYTCTIMFMHACMTESNNAWLHELTTDACAHGRMESIYKWVDEWVGGCTDRRRNKRRRFCTWLLFFLSVSRLVRAPSASILLGRASRLRWRRWGLGTRCELFAAPTRKRSEPPPQLGRGRESAHDASKQRRAGNCQIGWWPIGGLWFGSFILFLC